MTKQQHLELICDALYLVAFEEHDEPLSDLALEPLDQILFVAEAAVRVAKELLAGGDATGGIKYLREPIGEDERAEAQLAELLAREARLYGGVAGDGKEVSHDL